MINATLIKAKIVENEMTQAELANKLGMTAKTFSIKLKTGKFGLDEAGKMIEILKIDNPEKYFFSEVVA